MWILKFRQGGASTFTEAKIFCDTSQNPNTNSLIMADLESKAGNLFEMSKLFQERLEAKKPYLVGSIKKSNETKLEWEHIHSQIIITTGKNVNAARSYTYHNVHLSEVAFFPKLKEVLKALLQTVPDHKNTIVIGETTANGIGGDFYDEWRKAKNGKSDWYPLFLPWFWEEKYTRPLSLDGGVLYPIDDVSFDTDGGLNDFLAEEAQLRKNYSLREDQINWRRWCIVNKCQGEVISFRQEYPADEQEAFIVSGKCIFDRVKIKNQKTEVKKPLAVGNLVENENAKAEWRDDEKGFFKIYELPTKDGQYCIGADGTRTLTGDPAAAVVLNKKTNKTAAVLHGHLDPDQLKVRLRLLGLYFNTCLIGPENNDIGKAICEGLDAIYGNVYKVTNDKGDIKDIGFRTNSVSRDDLIAQFKQEIRENATELMDEALIDECLNFIKHDNGEISAAPGCHDDLVIARMIAGKMRKLYPYVHKKSDWKDGYKTKPSNNSPWSV